MTTWPLNRPLRVAEPPDLVFIDGRFRVACILTTLLRCRPTIVVHDFWNKLKPYGEILEFLDVVHRVESLGVFSPRPDIDDTSLKKLLRTYLLDPR